MDAKSKTLTTFTVGRFDSLCQVLFELGLLLAPITLLLVALHGLATHHFDVNETSDATHVRATVNDTNLFHIGESYPVYRFHPDWQEPIGQVVADQIDGNRIRFHFDPFVFRWPMGRQGKVLEITTSGQVRINLGSRSGLVPGNNLNVFSDRALFGVVQLTNIGESESIAQVIKHRDKIYDPASLLGKTVGEFTVANQIVVFNSPLINILDIVSLTLVLVVYLYLWRKYKGSPFLALGPRIAEWLKPSPTVKLVFHALLGIPTVWFLTEFGIRSIGYVAFLLNSNIIHTQLPDWLTFDVLQKFTLPTFTLALFSYEAVLLTRRVSPFMFLARRVAFKGGIFGHAAKEPSEHITIWIFQVVIAYAFGRTLGGFFQENFNQGIAASWPQAPAIIVPSTAPVSLDGFARTIQSLGYAFTHAPHPASEDAFFLTVQTVIYNACILGGLLGYSYSLLCYLWGKRIRNVDFTIVGWLVNAVCYGPLFGIVLWQMVPSNVGTDPIVTAGPLRTATFLVAVYLNVVYTLSIWNLGTLFGVMTDKGVRTTGFYSVVRHPSYTMEPLMFVLLFCRGLSSIGQWYAVGCFILVYWLRSEREDQFMGASNPDYITYREKTRYKFIPGIY